MTEKTYANADVTVVWKPELCIHSARCVGMLPKVFDPERRPWIDLSAAGSEAIRTAVSRCPSGALSLKEPAAAAEQPAAITIDLAPNGPLIVRGAHQLRSEGKADDQKAGTVAYCRCGASSRKPYCDGSHAKVGFKG